jgi:hypothetical protein
VGWLKKVERQAVKQVRKTVDDKLGTKTYGHKVNAKGHVLAKAVKRKEGGR